MAESVALLDTPKRKSLQSQADTLRVALKEYERTFAAEHDGRKPSRDEIKANKAAAGDYKQYQVIRDILAGKRDLEALKTPKRRTTRNRHERTDSAISLTPHRPRINSTPVKAHIHPNDLDPYDAPSSISPRVLPTAIGPTPRRDGTVLGIFDLLSNSSSRKSSQATPSSRKRKIDVLDETTVYAEPGQSVIAQTPSQKRRVSTNKVGDGWPGSTPRSSLATGKRNHSKTPISEGKKFMLNHFFATPSAVRFAGMIEEAETSQNPVESKTPLRDLVLGISPRKDNDMEMNARAHMDATPPYLRRSFSFKERLLSASGEPKPASKSVRRSLSGNLRHVSSFPKPLSQIIAENQQFQQEEEERLQRQREEEGDNEDDLDALREIEGNGVSVLVEDSQVVGGSHGTVLDEDTNADRPLPKWKKKGQKRTTRRVIMRPVKMRPTVPRKAAREDTDEDNETPQDASEEIEHTSHIEETQLLDDELEQDSDMEYLDEEDAEAVADPDFDDSRAPKSKIKPKSKKAVEAPDPSKPLGKPRQPKKDSQDALGDSRKINPNAYSHMNFRSLKIKNKNSKAKKGGRFGRGRR